MPVYCVVSKWRLTWVLTSAYDAYYGSIHINTYYACTYHFTVVFKCLYLQFGICSPTHHPLPFHFFYYELIDNVLQRHFCGSDQPPHLSCCTCKDRHLRCTLLSILPPLKLSIYTAFPASNSSLCILKFLGLKFGWQEGVLYHFLFFLAVCYQILI